MTVKLYYEDAYIREFSAEVLSVTECDGGFAVVLDRTAFFPEAGGQTSDKGFIANAEVYDVRENGNTVIHYTKSDVPLGRAECRIDFEERLEKMRIHTAEHIISGLFHKLYGVENTGFHLGHEDVTFDTSLPISREQLRFVERLANEAVMRNLPVTTAFPKPEELPSLEYRSKLDLTENVRIVYIGDVDACACCAPHVSHTGEIGIIKFVDAVSHKGGSRIRMLAGLRAYDYIAKLSGECSKISVALCAPPTEIADELSRVLESRAALEYKVKGLASRCAEIIADGIEKTDGNLVVRLDGLDADALRTFVNSASGKVGGTLVALTGEDGAYRYILYDASPDMAATVKKANAALGGKGGGRPPMAQGSFSATLEEIESYFKD